jgi:hypothetical protein
MEEEKFIFEDQHAMRLTHYVMAERCMQVEAYKIVNEINRGASHEDKWYELHGDGELPWASYEDDPIHQLMEDEAGELEEAARKARSVL